MDIAGSGRDIKDILVKYTNWGFIRTFLNVYNTFEHV